jgi:hypothetical protein
MLVLALGCPISRTLGLSTKQKFVTSRCFTPVQRQKLRGASSGGGGGDLPHVVNGMGFVEQVGEHWPSDCFGSFAAPTSWSRPRRALHSLGLVNDPVPLNCLCTLLIQPLGLSEDSLEADARV